MTITRTHTMSQMHVFSFDCVSTHENHSKDMHALEHDHSISNRFSEWRRQLVQTCGMPFTSVPAAAISEAATAKATALTKTGMSFPGQAA